MKKILFAFVLSIISLTCRAEELPTLEYVYQGLNVVDTLQTIQVAKHPDEYRELNPFIGSHPSDAKVIGAGAVFGIGHALLTNYFQEKYSPEFVKKWEYISIGVKASVVTHNYIIGVRIRF
jgi:hypothetical protein